MRKINQNHLALFASQLSFETWDEIFNGDDVDKIFNIFLNIFLRIFHSSFPMSRVTINNKDKGWLTPMLIALSQMKNDYYLLSRSYDNVTLKDSYKYICKKLKLKIKEAKTLYYNTKITQSSNKTKTIWKAVSQVTGKDKVQNDIQTTKIGNCIIDDQYKVSQLFNEYFATTAHKINTTKNNKLQTDRMNYLFHAFNTSFRRILIKNLTRTEVEKIIKNSNPLILMDMTKFLQKY
jgi:hypothetical protein